MVASVRHFGCSRSSGLAPGRLKTSPFSDSIVFTVHIRKQRIAQNSATHPGFFIRLSAKFEKRSPDKRTKIQRKWWKIVKRGIHFTPLRKPKPLSRLGLPRLFEKRCLVINQDPFNIIWSRKTSIKSASKIRSFHVFYTVAHRNKTLPLITKHFHKYKTLPPITKHFHKYKTLPQITKHFHKYKTLPQITKHFHRYKTLPQITKHFHRYKTLPQIQNTCWDGNICMGDKTLAQLKNNSTNTEHPYKSQNTCTT